MSDKSAQVIFAEDRLNRAGVAFGRDKYAVTNNERQSDAATGRYLSSAAELVHAAEALYRAHEDTRNRQTLAGLAELRDAPAFERSAPFEGEAP